MDRSRRRRRGRATSCSRRATRVPTGTWCASASRWLSRSIRRAISSMTKSSTSGRLATDAVELGPGQHECRRLGESDRVGGPFPAPAQHADLAQTSPVPSTARATWSPSPVPRRTRTRPRGQHHEGRRAVAVAGQELAGGPRPGRRGREDGLAARLGQRRERIVVRARAHPFLIPDLAAPTVRRRRTSVDVRRLAAPPGSGRASGAPPAPSAAPPSLEPSARLGTPLRAGTGWYLAETLRWRGRRLSARRHKRGRHPRVRRWGHERRADGPGRPRLCGCPRSSRSTSVRAQTSRTPRSG